MLKIQDMTVRVEQAQQQLTDEEALIQKGLITHDMLPQSLERITGHLLIVETLVNEKAALM